MEELPPREDWLRSAENLGVRTSATTYRVSDFVGWQKDATLNLRPHYQRGLVWKPQDRSFLIDSVIRQYPLPLIVMQDEVSEDGRLIRRIVDGQQRLRTLLAYIDISMLDDPMDADEFRYTPPEMQRRRISYSFEELSTALQQRILRTELQTVSLESGANDNIVLELYDRLNSTGSALNAQELRYAKRTGAFSDMCYRLARENQSRWTDWKLFNPLAIARMREVEFTGELLLLILNGVDKTAKGEIDTAYEQYAGGVADQDQLELAFQLVMDALDDVLAYPRSGDPFAMYRGKGWFYAAFAVALRILGHLNDEWRTTNRNVRKMPDLAPNLEFRLQAASDSYKQAQRRSPELVRAVSGSSSDKTSRLRRADFVYSGRAER